MKNSSTYLLANIYRNIDDKINEIKISNIAFDMIEI